MLVLLMYCFDFCECFGICFCWVEVGFPLRFLLVGFIMLFVLDCFLWGLILWGVLGGLFGFCVVLLFGLSVRVCSCV